MGTYGFRKSSATHTHVWKGRHRFEHWYRDNTVYFVTSKVRDAFPAFRSEEAKRVFWDRFDFYAQQFNFVPWVESLLDNHYHFIGYLKSGENLGPFMQRLHGSVAKLVNDLLPARHLPFWKHRGNRDYFDGCLRNPKQLHKAFCYTRDQAVRARIVRSHVDYPHTRVHIELDEAVRQANALNVWLDEVPYARYDKKPPP